MNHHTLLRILCGLSLPVLLFTLICIPPCDWALTGVSFAAGHSFGVAIYWSKP